METIKEIEEMTERLERGGISNRDLKILKGYAAVSTSLAIVGVVLGSKALLNKIRKEREYKKLKEAKIASKLMED